MIDVPVEVKDALREGTYKKNYRFVVGEEEWHEVGNIETIGRYSPSIHYDDDKMFTIRDTKTYRFIVDDDEHDTYTLYYYKSSDPNWRTLEPISRNTWEFTSDAYSAYVEINSSSGNLYSPVSVQNYYAETIDNNNLVSESVSIDERMCSGDTLKFGLCEGSSLEFQYFDKPNITGKRVQAFIDVDYGADEPYTIPMGFFDVKKCSRQASTGIIKATCYNKLQSEYLDAKANNNEAFEYYWGTNDKSLTLFELLSALLQGYAVEPDYDEVHGTSNIDGIITNPNDEFSFYNISLRLRSKYGVDSCMSYYQWVNNNNDPNYLTDVHPFIVSRVRIYNTDKTYRLCKSLIGNFEELEQTVYNRLVEEYDRANFTDSNGNHISGTTIVDGMYSEFSNIIGATVEETIYKSGAIGKRYDYYSTVMYEYEEAHGISHTRAVSGFPGYYDHTYRLRELFVDLLPQNFKFHIPWQIGIIAQNSSSSTLNGLIYSPIDGINRQYLVSNTYRYYTDSSLTTYEEKTMSGMLTPLGTEYNAYDRYQQVFALDENEMDPAYKIVVNPSQLADFTLRDLQSAAFETDCTFGQLSRTTDLFSGVELNHSRLYPADSLYPATDLYPNGAALSGFKSMYSKLWADEGNIHKWRYLIITYKGLNADQQEEDFTLQRTVNTDGTDDYNMSDNWLFRNLVWTAEQVAEYAEAMVAKMQDVTWFPFEMWCAGLPYLETGDEIEIPLNGESYTSYVLQRQLKGIQNLQDTYINGTLDIF